MRPRYTFLYILLFAAFACRAQSPVEFIENKGQWGDWFKYKAETSGGDVYLEKDGFRFVLADIYNNLKLDSFHHGQRKDNPVLKFHCYKVTLQGAKTAVIKGLKPQTTYNNYFLGNDSSRWKTGIHPNAAVDYMGIYDGIDMHVSSERGSVVYEFLVKPESDPSQVALVFEGQDEIKIKNKDLYIKTSLGDVKELKPYAYQYINDNRTEVACNYKLELNKLTFEFPNGYDHTQQLVIDPTVVFSTLTGSTADNWGFTATYDNAGNFYAGGLVNCLLAVGGGSFPVSPGAFQTTWGGGFGLGGGADGFAYAADISIIKYNSTGNLRLFATYLGGAGNEHPHSMIVDGNGNLIIAGRTLSSNYPITSGCFQNNNRGDWDMIVTSMNSTGTALVGSTYIGGSGADCVNFDSTEFGYGELKHNYGDESRSEVQVDNANNIYVTGCTSSTNFPTTGTAVSTTLSGLQDGIVFKLNSSCTNLIWSTYISGNGSDAGYVLAFDSLQQFVYVAGGTNSTNFPTTAGSWQPTFQGGGADGFITKFQNGSGYTIQKSTYVGTSGYDQVYGIQIYPTNDVYVMGQSIGGLFPVTAGVYSNPNSTQFIMKTDPNLATDIVSTVFGSGASTFTNISPSAFLVDTCSNVYYAGWGGTLGITGATTGTCTGMFTTSDAYQSATDGNDFYFIVFGANLTAVRYATFYGRSCTSAIHGEHVDGGTSRFDKNGVIYQAICANCGGTPTTNPGGSCPAQFPTTPSTVWGPVDASGNCNEAALKIAFEIGPVAAHVTAGPSTSGCAPLSVTFTNTSNNGLGFVWNFGDGSPVSTSFSATHTFTASGVYTVTLAASNTGACFVTNDTARLVIIVDTNRVTAAFTSDVTNNCGPYTAVFTNTSVYGSTPGAAALTVFTWDFGDGTSYTGVTPPVHTYTAAGSYNVTLTMVDTSACNSPDVVSHTVSITGFNVTAHFTMPDTVCLGTPVTPVTTTANGIIFNWTFGDGQVSTNANPTFTYNAVGSYTVTYIAANSAACNGADTFSATIKVIGSPTAAFTFAPDPPEANVPAAYTNLSENATRYLWDFGDATTTTETNPVHQFNRTGIYNSCLTAYNNSNCPAKACKPVSADVVPLAGVPTAFSPNGDGDNDILYVRGGAIKTLDLRIYNRWGQLIFETTSKNIGWDGTFNGQPQPIDAYGFVLLVSFINDTNKTLKGNITLLR